MMVNSLKALAAGAFALMAGNAWARADGPGAQMAMIGAHAAGAGYEYGIRCGAGADLLQAFKAKKKAKYIKAGAAFESEFASGRAEASRNWNAVVTAGGNPLAICDDGKFVAQMAKDAK